MLYIQGFWQVMEEKAKFRGIFRDKFAENSANFVGISREFQVKKRLILWLFSTQISIEIDRFCADQTSVFNIFLTEVIICSFNNNTLQKWTNGKAFNIMASAQFLQHVLCLVVSGLCLHVLHRCSDEVVIYIICKFTAIK